ncbi:TadE/TadG family type IV pilus assembly protein [Vibrio sp. F74]|uniref:TadE/TadG family type IV pilus assembly protein n=1 Tax=Vibrio sp. F74 TaxID=700020 RepID=UPI0035F5EA8C
MKLITKKRQKGVVAIEFAIGFFAFWLMVAAWVEMSYMSYVSALGDYAISTASREAKKDTETYVSTFKNVLVESDSVWSNFVNPSNFQASVYYVKDLSELFNIPASEICTPADGAQTATCGNEIDSAIAIYKITYQFTSVFTYFFDTSSVFSREVIVVQEYERTLFKI